MGTFRSSCVLGRSLHNNINMIYTETSFSAKPAPPPQAIFLVHPILWVQILPTFPTPLSLGPVRRNRHKPLLCKPSTIGPAAVPQPLATIKHLVLWHHLSIHHGNGVTMWPHPGSRSASCVVMPISVLVSLIYPHHGAEGMWERRKERQWLNASSGNPTPQQ